MRDAVGVDDIEGMKKGMEELQQEAMQMGQAMYSQGGAAPGGPEGAAPGGGAPGSEPKKGGNDDNVIDAEFK